MNARLGLLRNRRRATSSSTQVLRPAKVAGGGPERTRLRGALVLTTTPTARRPSRRPLLPYVLTRGNSTREWDVFISSSRGGHGRPMSDCAATVRHRDGGAVVADAAALGCRSTGASGCRCGAECEARSRSRRRWRCRPRPHRDLLVLMAFGVVLVALLVHGLALGRLLRRSGLAP